MKKVDVEAAALAAMSLEQLEELAAPVVAALRTKREVLSKEESKRRKQEYDRRRRATTVAVTVRMADAESAAAIRSLVKRIVGLSREGGRTVADIVSATEKRMPVGRRKAVGEPKDGATRKVATPKKGVPKNASTTPSKLAATSQNGGLTTMGKTHPPTTVDGDGAGRQSEG